MKNKGFTLIELVVVIVILGILSVTAAPKFLNLQTDARNATLKGVKGALNGSIGIIYGKAIIAGYDGKFATYGDESEKIIAGCPECVFSYGYPMANRATMRNVVDGVGLHSDKRDFILAEWEQTGDKATIKIAFPSSIKEGTTDKLDSDGCYVQYTSYLEQNKIPLIEVVPCK